MILDLFLWGLPLTPTMLKCSLLPSQSFYSLLMIWLIIDLLSKASSRCLFWTWDESYHGACWQKFQANPVNSHFHVKSASKLNRYYKRSVLLLKTRLPDLAWFPGQNIAGSKPLRWIKNISLLLLLLLLLLLFLLLLSLWGANHFKQHVTIKYGPHADILLHFPDIMFHATLLSKKHFRLPATWSIFACSLTTCIVRLF